MGIPSKILIIFLSGVLLAAASTVSAFNITKILESRGPEFSTFNNLLTQTGVYRGINSRSTVTVLAIPNDKIGDLAGKSPDILINIIRTHVVLDYFDIPKLRNINKPIMATTQYQSTGVAVYQQGFLNITKANGQVVFASAVRGAPHDVVLLGSVISQPFNVSVLSVSGHIVTPGIEPITLSAPSPKAAAAPAPTKPEVEAPAPSSEPEAPSPSKDGVAADAPAPEAESPASDSPAESPDSEAPASDAPAADEVADKSGSSRQIASASLGLLLVLGSFNSCNMLKYWAILVDIN